MLGGCSVQLDHTIIINLSLLIYRALKSSQNLQEYLKSSNKGEKLTNWFGEIIFLLVCADAYAGW